MERRQFIELTAMTAGTGIALAGCLGGSNSEQAPANNSTNETNETTTSDDDTEPEPEPEGGDGEPYYHYDLNVTDIRENGQPVWIDQHERIYGRDELTVTVSDDWWRTTDELYTFEDETGRVENVVVPPGETPIVAVGGQENDEGGRIYKLHGDRSNPVGHELVYQFDYGRVSNSLNHVVYDDIVVLACYELSEYDEKKNANEVILSTDGGRHFKRILEVPLNTTDAANLHIHDVEYDPYAERIWVAVGDHGNSQLYWSDDLGESWETVDEQGAITMVTQIAAFKNCVVLGSDGTPEGILRWERDGPTDTPTDADSFERVHVEIETDPDDEHMEMYARRRWHVREDLETGRELCLMPFGYSPMNDDATDSVVLASVDGDEWYELYRTETRDVLLTNVMGPLSMDGERRTIISDSNQGEGYQIEATVPKFWD